MSLNDLIAQRKGLSPITEAEIEAEVKKQEEPTGVAAEGTDTPYGVAQVVTPKGLEIYYQAGPKRLYRVRQLFSYDDPMIPSGGFVEDPDYPWQEVPSVSTILSVLEKGGLSWWGMKVGVEGMLELGKRDLLNIDVNPDVGLMFRDTTDEIVDRLKSNKLTVNHVKDKAADRGTNVHSALESFVDTGVVPDPSLFPENERGYVEGLVAFINDAHPTAHHSELMVASLDGFAGRFDLVANLDFAGDVVIKTYPKRKPVRAAVNGTWLLDLKTSKDVYPSYHLQLAAYRAAMEECGYGNVDHAGVVRVTSDGRYELVECRASYEHFLSVLDVYRALQEIK